MTVIFTEEQKKEVADVIAWVDDFSRDSCPVIPQVMQRILNTLKLLSAAAASAPPELTAAEKMHQGCFAESHIEEVADTLWPDLVGRIGSDHYDNSLELYFLPEAPADLACTEAQAKELLALGFTQFWMNFCDGTEIHAGEMHDKVSVGQRHPANIPRGGMRQSVPRSRLYTEIVQLENQVQELRNAPSFAVRKLALVAEYVKAGPMTKEDLDQLLRDA